MVADARYRAKIAGPPIIALLGSDPKRKKAPPPFRATGRIIDGMLGREPVEASPTFVLFVLPSGLALGLWGTDSVQPAPVAAGGGSEIGFKVKSAAEIDKTHTD